LTRLVQFDRGVKSDPGLRAAQDLRNMILLSQGWLRTAEIVHDGDVFILVGEFGRHRQYRPVVGNSLAARSLRLGRGWTRVRV